MSKLIPLFSEEQKTRLELADYVIALDTDELLKCRLALYVVQWTFHNSTKKADIFFTNPMNTIGARIIQSALEKSTIDIYSEACSLVKDLKIDWSDLIGFSDLRNHRTFQSHTYLGKFDDKQVQNFIEQDLHRKDDVASKAWFVRATIIQFMIKNNLKPKIQLHIQDTSELADMVFNIFKYSTKDLSASQLDSITSMMKMFSKALEGVYINKWQEKFKERYCEGPFGFSSP